MMNTWWGAFKKDATERPELAGILRKLAEWDDVVLRGRKSKEWRLMVLWIHEWQNPKGGLRPKAGEKSYGKDT